MSWLTLLYYGNYALTVIAGVMILFAVAPAYKRTRHRPFLYLTFAFMLRLFDLACDYTIGRLRMPHGQYVAYRTLRMFTSFATVILLTLGIICSRDLIWRPFHSRQILTQTPNQAMKPHIYMITVFYGIFGAILAPNCG